MRSVQQAPSSFNFPLFPNENSIGNALCIAGKKLNTLGKEVLSQQVELRA